MQVVCGNCQLNFDAPDGATGLLCPICRTPLRPEAAGDGAGKAAAEPATVDWSGGTLDDLIALLSAPAVSARVEVMPATGGAAVGEVHLLAGGVSEALWGGQSVDDALDKLRGVVPARFKIEPRLPNPANGDLSERGPESGTLDARPLAHLMRYCEDYVITCSIEVWRGNENARVEYKRGEISGVTIGGIDAPERLAEVMQWASGNYRLVVPAISLPAVAPRRPTPVPMAPVAVPAPAPSAQAARGSATKTIFGIPQAEIAAARAAAAAEATASAAAPQAQAAAPAAAPAATKTTTPAPAPTAPPVVAPPAAPAAPMAAAAAAPAVSKSATKTIFGVPVPKLPEGFIPGRATPVGRTLEAAVPAAAPAADSGRNDRKTGARKVAVPAPEISPPSGSAAPPAPVAAMSMSTTAAPAATASMSAPPPVPADAARATQQGYDSGSARVTQTAGKKVADATEPTRVPAPTRTRETPIVTYVGLGFLFGLALLAVYQLVGRLAH
jgi:hypothetical protein